MLHSLLTDLHSLHKVFATRIEARTVDHPQQATIARFVGMYIRAIRPLVFVLSVTFNFLVNMLLRKLLVFSVGEQRCWIKPRTRFCTVMNCSRASRNHIGSRSLHFLHHRSSVYGLRHPISASLLNFQSSSVKTVLVRTRATHTRPSTFII